tara:strand:- start:7307 stop:8578 length:1272 start_codon:yes stop_codon:yes gene_type:complete
MASVVNVPVMGFNPLAQGMGIAKSLGNLSQQALQLNVQRQTMPGQISAQNAQNNIISQTAPNKIGAMNAQYQGQENTAIPLAKANLGLAQARVPAMQASTASTVQGTKFAPLTAAVSAQNSLNAQAKMGQMGSRYGQAYQYAKMLSQMSPPARAAYISLHQTEYNKNLAALAGPQPAQSQPLNLLTPDLMKNTLGYAPQQAPTPLPAQQSPSPASGQPMSAEDATVARANQMYANKQLTTTSQQNRYQAGVAMERFLNNPQMSDALDKLGTYAGPMGAVQKIYDMATGDPKYTAYKSASSQMAPILSGGISGLEGFAKTNQGLNEGLNFFKRAQDVLGNNPEQAQQYINQGKRVLSAELQSIGATAHPVFNTSRVPGQPDVNTHTAPIGSTSMAKVQGPDGKIYNVPMSDVDGAVASGGHRIG